MRLSKHYKLPFTTIRISYGGEKIVFSLMRELRINENDLNSELASQPRMYGFCLLLHKKLLTRLEEIKVERNKIYGQLYFKAKEQKSQITNRLFTDDMSKAWVEKHPKYVEISLKCIKARDDADTIFSCIKAFEQRKDLAQSISSNLRNETK